MRNFSTEHNSSLRRAIAALGPALLLVVITLLVYAPTFQAGFLWDDNYLVWDNPLNRSGAGLWKTWFSKETAWPLTSTLIWVDWQLWGNQPLGYHVQTLLFHAGNAVLLWLLLRQLCLPGAWLAALLWAVHPVNAATVAWVSELKNTLSTVLVLAAMLAYLKFDESGRRRLYWLALGLFGSAMLAKSSVIGVPLVLLLCVWWKRERVAGADWLRIAPWLAIAAVLGAVTVWFQVFNPGQDSSFIIPPGNFAARVASAGWAVWFYVGKAIAPGNLMMVYPRWQIHPQQPVEYLPTLMVVAALLCFWLRRKAWGRHALLAAGSFLLLIFPVLGFVNMSYMIHTLVADHFQYLPVAPILAGVVAGGWTMVSRWGKRTCAVAAVVATLLVGTLAGLTTQRAWIMRGHIPLWRDTIARNPDAWMAYYHLGTEWILRGDQLKKDGRQVEARTAYVEAEDWLRRGTERQPRYSDMFHNLGVALARQGRRDEAIVMYQKTLAMEERRVDTHYNLGVLLRNKGEQAEARRHFLRILELSNEEHLPALVGLVTLSPNDSSIGNRLAVALEKGGHLAEALEQYRKVLALQPEAVTTRNDIARVERLLRQERDGRRND